MPFPKSAILIASAKHDAVKVLIRQGTPCTYELFASTRVSKTCIMNHETTAPFDIEIALQRVEKSIEGFARAALFELYDDGFTTLFQQLVACLISIRTYDEVSLPAARRLFEAAKTPAEMMQLSPEKIAQLIEPSTFAFSKAEQILGIARRRAGRARRRTAARFGNALGAARRRAEMRGAGAGNRVRAGAHRRRYSRASRHQSLELRSSEDAGKNRAGAGKSSAAKIFRCHQQTAGAVWKTYLHRHRAEMFDLSAQRDVPENRRRKAPLKKCLRVLAHYGAASTRFRFHC